MTLIAEQRAAKELRDESEGAGHMRERMVRHVMGAFVGLHQPEFAMCH
jgi:hypothetical protein